LRLPELERKALRRLSLAASNLSTSFVTIYYQKTLRLQDVTMWLDESCSVVQQQLQALLPASTTIPWAWVARQLIETLRRFPAGVTEVRYSKIYTIPLKKHAHLIASIICSRVDRYAALALTFSTLSKSCA
jgi:Cell division control protein 24, OB domain 1